MSALPRRTLLGVFVLMALRTRRPVYAAPATPMPAPSGAQTGIPVSLLIQNAGATADQLMGATSALAQAITLHATHLEQGERVMLDVSEIGIPARSMVSLEPGSSHLMLIGLKQSLVQGQVFPLTLHFAQAGDVSVEVRVRRKQDAAGVPETPPVAAGSLTILHASVPPAPMAHE